MNHCLKFLCMFLCIMLLIPCASGEEEKRILTERECYSFYDGSVFVGDSITQQLKVYVREKKGRQEEVPDITFLTAQSYMLYTASRRNLLENHTNILFQGEKRPLCRIIGRIMPEKMFVLLGVNDYAGKDIEKNIGYAQRILDLTKEFSPDTQVYFFSLTPVRPAFCRSKDYRALWDDYNAALEKLCEETDARYIDIASDLKDEDGYMKEEYSSDGKYHMNPRGLEVWLTALKKYAQNEYNENRWTPKEV